MATTLNFLGFFPGLEMDGHMFERILLTMFLIEFWHQNIQQIRNFSSSLNFEGIFSSIYEWIRMFSITLIVNQTKLIQITFQIIKFLEQGGIQFDCFSFSWWLNFE